MLKRQIQLAYPIEEFKRDVDLKVLLDQFTNWKLVQEIKHPRPVWADEYYFDRFTYVYDVTSTGTNEAVAGHLLNLLEAYDILN